MIPLSPKVIERSNKELIALHKRLITSYLVCRGIKLKSRAKFFKLYNHYIDEQNIRLYYFCPIKIFVRALVKDKLELIQYAHGLPDKKIPEYKKLKKKNLIKTIII